MVGWSPMPGVETITIRPSSEIEQAEREPDRDERGGLDDHDPRAAAARGELEETSRQQHGDGTHGREDDHPQDESRAQEAVERQDAPSQPAEGPGQWPL